MLIANKSKVNVKCTPGWTPLDLAVHQGHGKVVKASSSIILHKAKQLFPIVSQSGVGSFP